MKTIWLLRHGETTFNVEGRLQGTSDSPLTPAGLARIRSLAVFFSGKNIDSAFSSDLKRAVTTAELILQDQPDLSLNKSELLRERCFGIFEGRKYVEYREEVGDKHLTLEFKPEQGESLLEVNSRALVALKMLQESPGNNLLVVGHGSFNRCFLTMACKLALTQIFDIKQANCCVNRLEQQADGSWALEMLNFIEY